MSDTTEESAPRERLGFGRGLGIVLAVLLNVALIAAIGWVATNRDRVSDQFAVWRYTPSAAVAEYADRATMTGEGRFLFYASRPSVSTGTAFDGACASHQEGVGILGCYLPADRSIHLFDVTDPQLDGLEEVVAAHELLHAAWDRMPDSERDALAPLLEAEVTKRADDADLADKLAFYASSEPGERLNELHSILGTEYADLSPALEAHYALYFTDRSAIAALHATSNAVFVEQAKRVNDLVAQINDLAAGIDSDYAAYNSGYDQLGADIQDFNSRAQAGQFASQAEFDAERDGLVARQADLDALYASIDARNTQYDTLVTELDALNAKTDELNKAVNISPRDSTGVAG